MVELSGPTNVTFSGDGLQDLKVAFPLLIADNDALVAARQATATAASTANELRQQWDVAHKKLRQCVAFHTSGEQWKDYLIDFSTSRAVEEEELPIVVNA